MSFSVDSSLFQPTSIFTAAFLMEQILQSYIQGDWRGKNVLGGDRISHCEE